MIVPINGTVKLQMSKKQKIRTVTNPKENAINIRTVVGDPTTILIIGQQPDVTRLELEDTDGNKESYEVIVQADIEYLRTQTEAAPCRRPMSRSFPTSNNTVILSGTVTRAEDVAVIRGLVQSIGFKYIDGMRVGGVQQVQLDVIIVQVSRSDLRNLTFNFLGSSTLRGRRQHDRQRRHGWRGVGRKRWRPAARRQRCRQCLERHAGIGHQLAAGLRA